MTTSTLGRYIAVNDRVSRPFGLSRTSAPFRLCYGIEIRDRSDMRIVCDARSISRFRFDRERSTEKPDQQRYAAVNGMKNVIVLDITYNTLSLAYNIIRINFCSETSVRRFVRSYIDSGHQWYFGSREKNSLTTLEHLE